MSYTRRIGFGWSIGVDGSGGNNFTTLGAVVDGFKRSGVKVDNADISILSDFWSKFAQCKGDGGSLEFSIGYDPTDTTSTQVLTGLLNNPNAADPKWALSYPAVAGSGSGSGPETFNGILESFDVEGMKDKLVMASVKIKVTGQPGLTGVDA